MLKYSGMKVKTKVIDNSMRIEYNSSQTNVLCCFRVL